MNAAELTTVITVLGCPAAAGLTAASEKAGWFTILFVIVGLVVGIAFGFVVHKLAYFFLAVGGRQSSALFGWAMLFAYTLVPMALAFGAMLGTGVVTVWLLRHVL